jgi:hypothetical protein
MASFGLAIYCLNSDICDYRKVCGGVVSVDRLFVSFDIKRKDERSWCGQDLGRTFCKMNWRRR